MVDYLAGKIMYLIKKPKKIDLKIYSKEASSPQNFYGLPKKYYFANDVHIPIKNQTQNKNINII